MITGDDVRHVAKLARLHLEPDEAARMTAELVKILEHVATISRLGVEVSEVEPMAHVLDVTDVTRPDRERPGCDRDDALRNAPAVSDDCFRVPRMGA